MKRVQPLILCGGSGTRLFPLSSDDNPKQFIGIRDKGTLLDETFRRGKLIASEGLRPFLIMNGRHANLFKHNSGNVIYENYANDTAVAIARIALKYFFLDLEHIKYSSDRYDPEDTTLVILPADHYIVNDDAFVNDIKSGINKVTKDNIVLFGIEPTGPETKYGYIFESETVIKFKEKPDMNTAIELIKQNALWNSVIVAARMGTILEALRKANIINNYTLKKEYECELKGPSFDVAVLQEYKNLTVQHCHNWCWSDVGTWDSFLAIPEIKLSINQGVHIPDCKNVHVLNKNDQNIVVIGCEDLLIVNKDKNLLIMNINGDHNNKLKEIASKIQRK